MCGICGIVDFSGNDSERTVRAMNESLKHRGPDAGGVFSYPDCVLGHRRLSILDLSESANQPMISEDGKIGLVFNGEIYNFLEIRQRLESKGHSFRTKSDTEVILQLYIEKQEAALSELNGMFSLAIWDQPRKRLVLARDRVGKKPLYYCVNGCRLSFSSELNSLIQDPLVGRTVRDQSVVEFLLYDFIPAPDTVFREVHKLPAAHYAVFDSAGMTVKRYWNRPMPQETADYGKSAASLTELLSDAVRMRLISDVPLGAFLSGGVDSSLITALMAAQVPGDVRTFSISFPGTTHDESRWSTVAAAALKTEHRSYPVQYDIQGLFTDMIRHFGEPFGDSSALPTWRLCEHTRRSVTVALSGDGGDELFGGYERYLARRIQVLYDLLPLSVRERLIEPLVDRLHETTDYYGTSLIKKAKLFLRAARRMRSEPLAAIPRTFSLEEATRLTGLAYDPDRDPVLAAAREWADLDAVSAMMFTDMETYLAEDILTKVDRMSMAHALEVRSPLLDFRIVELACSLPLDFKISGLGTKRILKDVARGRVPSSIIERSKYGFQVPLGMWFKTDLESWAGQRLMEPPHNMFDQEVVRTIWNQNRTGRADNGHKIWLLLFFNEWYRQFHD